MVYTVCIFGLEVEEFKTIDEAHNYILEQLEINKKLKMVEEYSIKIK